jgi:hypothetical protein
MVFRDEFGNSVTMAKAIVYLQFNTIIEFAFIGIYVWTSFELKMSLILKLVMRFKDIKQPQDTQTTQSGWKTK